MDILSRIAQLTMCLSADPGVGSHTFMEIDHEIISTAILLPSADSRIQAKVCKYCLTAKSSLPRKKSG